MESTMDRRRHHEYVQRAIAIGRGNYPAGLDELVSMVKMPSAEIRRLAASAIGKLSGFGADPTMAVAALAPLALHDPHPQVQQYALTALKAYGTAGQSHLADLRDLASMPKAKDYVSRAAASTVSAIEESIQIAEWLSGRKIVFRYDESIRIIEGMAIRPDFYLPEFDVYIEYWGMDTIDYKIGMLKKLKLYQQEGKRLISVNFSEKSRIGNVLSEKLSRYAPVSGGVS